jgi:hypothetical protein
MPGAPEYKRGCPTGIPFFILPNSVYEANCHVRLIAQQSGRPPGRPNGVSNPPQRIANPSCRVRQNTKGDVQRASPFLFCRIRLRDELLMFDKTHRVLDARQGAPQGWVYLAQANIRINHAGCAQPKSRRFPEDNSCRTRTHNLR